MKNQTDKHGNLYLVSATPGMAWKLYAYKGDRVPIGVGSFSAVFLIGIGFGLALWNCDDKGRFLTSARVWLGWLLFCCGLLLLSRSDLLPHWLWWLS